MDTPTEFDDHDVTDSWYEYDREEWFNFVFPNRFASGSHTCDCAMDLLCSICWLRRVSRVLWFSLKNKRCPLLFSPLVAHLRWIQCSLDKFRILITRRSFFSIYFIGSCRIDCPLPSARTVFGIIPHWTELKR